VWLRFGKIGKRASSFFKTHSSSPPATSQREMQTWSASRPTVVTNDGFARLPFVRFSTGKGDAWFLEPREHLAMCLVWAFFPHIPAEARTDGELREPRPLRDVPIYWPVVAACT
jgi:hypothetical protein